MSATLSALGLEPATEDPPEPEAPEAAEPPEPAVTPEPEGEPVVVPPGADNPDAVKALIQAERKKAREANAAARDLERQLKERDDAALPLEDRVTAAEKRAADADLKALRLEVAMETGLSVKLAPRLAGSTKEELVADAAALVAEFGAKPPAPSLDGGYKKDPPKTADPNRDHNAFVLSLLQGTQQD
jgi:hypothetical protein